MINSNNSGYSIVTDNTVASILSHFNDNYIYDTVSKSITNRLRPYNTNMPNIVISYEQYFKQAIDIYPDAKDAIWDVRNDVYKQIIRLLCDAFQLSFDNGDMQDLYSSAVYLYSFLVSEFQTNLIEFFTNYIYKEKNNIYDVLNLGNFKGNKDSSMMYSKKIFRNTRLGIICANLDEVINNVNVFDIDFDTYLEMIYGYENRNVAKHISTVVTPTNDFFKEYISSCFNGNFRSILITSIRLRLQELASEGDLNTNNIVKDEEEEQNNGGSK